MEMQALKGPVDEIVHEPRRLAILTAIRNTPATFSELKEAVELTDGNLDSHLRKLEDAGYVVKEVRSNPLLRRRRETVFKSTEKGRRAFDGYLDSMERRLEEARVVAATGGATWNRRTLPSRASTENSSVAAGGTPRRGEGRAD